MLNIFEKTAVNERLGSIDVIKDIKETTINPHINIVFLSIKFLIFNLVKDNKINPNAIIRITASKVKLNNVNLLPKYSNGILKIKIKQIKNKEIFFIYFQNF